MSKATKPRTGDAIIFDDIRVGDLVECRVFNYEPDSAITIVTKVLAIDPSEAGTEDSHSIKVEWSGAYHGDDYWWISESPEFVALSGHGYVTKHWPTLKRESLSELLDRLKKLPTRP